jgi:DNA-binding response OmpR family regulator
MRYVFAGPRYDLTCAENGQAALFRLENESDPFDVIIVDERMPKLSGSELVSEIKKRRIDGKIIVVSANLSAETREAYGRMGVNVMFSKPFNVEVLRSAVERLAV